MSVLKAHGLSIELPRGWEGRIYRRMGGDPTLHAANYTLPAADGDFGGSATQRMPHGGSFLVLTEYQPGQGLAPGEGLFAAEAIPLPLHPGQFHPRTLHVARPGQRGFQHFFTAGRRPFSLYAVIKPRASGTTAAAAAAEVAAVNGVLATVAID